jgi:K+-transporting ATPase ATPase C chain
MSKKEQYMTAEQKKKWNFKPIVGLTVISLLICGLFYPLLITIIGQVFFPYQANGEIVQLNGQPVGSNLIAQSFTSPLFFHPRNETSSPSASGVDPDITLQDAYLQIPKISNATGIPEASLTKVVNENQEGTFWIFGSPYVNVLRINLILIKNYPSVYSDFSGK